jgi:hypothetical protein
MMAVESVLQQPWLAPPNEVSQIGQDENVAQPAAELRTYWLRTEEPLVKGRLDREDQSIVSEMAMKQAYRFAVAIRLHVKENVPG